MIDRADYFAGLSEALKAAHCHRPTLVIDRDRLDSNIDRVKAKLDPNIALRLVDKSLPASDLIARLIDRLGTRKLMTFHLPVTLAMLERFSDIELLFGKPMPVAALEHAFRTAAPEIAERLSLRVVHLVDSAERLEQYRALAERLGIRLDIVFEVNIGMNRGGISHPGELSVLLARITGDPAMRIRGIMGYEAHIPAIPALFGGARAARARTDALFSAFAERLGPGQRDILNTGGSKTALAYGREHPANEVSMGSAFLLPTDFDGGLLEALEPALFIATPVLKVGDAALPGLPRLTRILAGLGLFPKRGLFVYGGKWMAQPAWPEGMKVNSLWGESSNQQFMGLGKQDLIAPDDFAFFRPTQSEAVLQQFGRVAIVSAGQIVEFLEPLPAG